MLMLCNSCGFKVPDNARFCKNCGAEVNAAQRGAFQDGSYSNLIPHKLQPVTATASIPRRSGHAHQYSHQQPAVRLLKSTPEPARASSQWEHDNIPQEMAQEPIFQRKYRSNSPANGDLTLADGEVELKTYHCSEWRAPWYRLPRDDFKGYLTVTNRRIVYRSIGANVRSVREIPIEFYRGFECCYGHGWNVIEILAGLLVSLSGIGLLFFNILAVPLAVFLAGVVLILMSHRRTMVLRIHSDKSVSPIALARLSNYVYMSGHDTSDPGVPVEQTDTLMMEFGALVEDARDVGIEAAERWAS
jgi:hypothetical protein